MNAMEAMAGLVWGRNIPAARSAAAAALGAIDAKAGRYWARRLAPTSWALARAVTVTARAFCSDSLQIRPLKDGGHEAIAVLPGAVENREVFLFSAKRQGASVALLKAGQGLNPERLASHLCETVAGYDRLLSPDQVGRMVGTAVRCLGGVAMHGTNVFYVPPPGVGPMRAFLRDAGQGEYSLTQWAISTDGDTVAAVATAVRDELGQKAADLMAKVHAGNLSRRQAKAVAKEAEGLIARAAAHEQQLSVDLRFYREQLDAARTASAVSALLSASV